MGKTALIITDGTEAVRKMADDIVKALEGCKVTVVSAADFEGTHLLPADLCFFGAESPNPPSFAYLDRLLAHINLAGRGCGIFSTSKSALDYLGAMIRDSELSLYGNPFSEGDIEAWAKTVASSSGITAWH